MIFLGHVSHAGILELDHPDLYNGKARRATAIATAIANPTLHYGVTVRVAFMLGWKRQ